MNNYKHLSLKERTIIEYLNKLNKSISFIAKELGRNKSTISRELKRNLGAVRKERRDNDYAPTWLLATEGTNCRHNKGGNNSK